MVKSKKHVMGRMKISTFKRVSYGVLILENLLNFYYYCVWYVMCVRTLACVCVGLHVEVQRQLWIEFGLSGHP